jgi:cell division septation protein DedD
MWLGGGSRSYLETTVTHEVTHVVFHDATTNPFHDPPTWFNEGFAVWSEQQSARSQASAVRAAALTGDLLAFDGISESFPIDAQAAGLAYSEGAPMVQMIIDDYGRDAIADIAAAWRNGAGDAEALEAGTGVSADQLYADYFAGFGVPPPTAIEPAPILPSNVDKPPQPEPASPQPAPSSTEAPSPSSSPVEEPSGGSGDGAWLWLLGAAAIGVGVGAAVAVRRRQAPGSSA